MADFFGNTYKAQLLSYTFKTAGTAPAGVGQVSLHTADPGVDGQTANEASGGAYAAQATTAATWNTPTTANPSVCTNAAAVTFPVATGSGYSAGATMNYMGFWKGAGRTAADFIGRAPLTSPQAFTIGQQPIFPIASISVDLTDT